MAVLLLLSQVTVGVATYYPASEFAGRPLYCDYQFEEELVYSEGTADWVAVDVGLYQSGEVWCGDELLILFEDGRRLRARALDAGTFEGYYVADWPGLPIVVDIPEHLAHVSAGRAMVINLSRIERGH